MCQKMHRGKKLKAAKVGDGDFVNLQNIYVDSRDPDRLYPTSGGNLEGYRENNLSLLSIAKSENPESQIWKVCS